MDCAGVQSVVSDLIVDQANSFGYLFSAEGVIHIFHLGAAHELQLVDRIPLPIELTRRVFEEATVPMSCSAFHPGCGTLIAGVTSREGKAELMLVDGSSGFTKWCTVDVTQFDVEVESVSKCVVAFVDAEGNMDDDNNEGTVVCIIGLQGRDGGVHLINIDVEAAWEVVDANGEHEGAPSLSPSSLGVESDHILTLKYDDDVEGSTTATETVPTITTGGGRLVGLFPVPHSTNGDLYAVVATSTSSHAPTVAVFHVDGVAMCTLKVVTVDVPEGDVVDVVATSTGLRVLSLGGWVLDFEGGDMHFVIRSISDQSYHTTHTQTTLPLRTSRPRSIAADPTNDNMLFISIDATDDTATPGVYVACLSLDGDSFRQVSAAFVPCLPAPNRQGGWSWYDANNGLLCIAGVTSLLRLHPTQYGEGDANVRRALLTHDGLGLTPTCENSLRSVFLAFDKDGDGILSHHEFDAFMQATNGMPCPEEAWEHLSGTVCPSADAFVEYYTAQSIEDPHETMKDLRTLGFFE